MFAIKEMSYKYYLKGFEYVPGEIGEMRTSMIQLKTKIVYCIGMILLWVFIYVAGSYCLYGTVYSLVGDGNRHVWDAADLIETGENFQMKEDGTFLATTSDASFLIQESFGVRTVVIEVGKMDETLEAEFFCDPDLSFHFQLHKGVNYFQLPEQYINRIRIRFLLENGTQININRITMYGSRVVPSWFLVLITAMWIIVAKAIYRLAFCKKDGGEMKDKKGQMADKTYILQIPERMQSVSYLRVIALGMILYDHLGAMRNSEWAIKRMIDFAFCTPLHIIQDFGALGVSLFYLLTGFLFIHSNKGKDKCVHSSCRKIVKLYMFTVVSFMTFGAFQWGLNQVNPTYWAQFSLKDWLGCATLINYFNGVGENVNGTTWFLIPLFAFYLLSSVCYQAAKKDAFKALVFLEGAVTVLTILGVVGYRIKGMAYVSTLIPFIYIPVAGMVIYACAAGEISYLKGLAMGGFNYIMMVFSFYRLNAVYYTETPYTISAVYAVLLLLVFIAGEKKFRESKAIDYLRKISLSVYLVHMTWGGLFMSLLTPKMGFSVAFICSLILVMAVSWLHYILIEKGLLKAI